MPVVANNHCQLICIIDALIPDRRQILCFDSLVGASGYPFNHGNLVQFSLFVLTKLWSTIHPNIPFEETYTTPRVFVPIQPNMFDCGVFLLLNASYLSHRKQFFVDIDIPNQYDLSRWYPPQLCFSHRNTIMDNVSLKPEQWVTDNALSFCLMQLVANDSDILFIPPSTYTYWKEYAVDQTSQWTMHLTYEQVFVGPKTLMVPISQGGHWQMLCICNPGSMTDCCMFVFDSLARNGVPGNSNELKDFAEFLIKTGKSNLSRYEIDKQMVVHTVTVNVPIQRNGFDCGIHCIANMRKFVIQKALFLDATAGQTINGRHWHTEDDVLALREEMWSAHITAVVSLVGQTNDDLEK